MEKHPEFVPNKLAVKLIELGFDEPCLGGYDINNNWWYHPNSDVIFDVPTWQQSFDWIFRQFDYDWELHIGTLFITINCKINNKYYKISELTNEACLEKLIELVADEK